MRPVSDAIAFTSAYGQMDIFCAAHCGVAGDDLSYEATFRFERLTHVGVEAAFSDIPDDLHVRVKPLERRVLVVAVDCAMRDAAIVEILNEVRGEEASFNAVFAVDDEVDLFAQRKVR